MRVVIEVRNHHTRNLIDIAETMLDPAEYDELKLVVDKLSKIFPTINFEIIPI